MTAQWLSEPGRSTELPWFFDAPWEAANSRTAHKFVVRTAPNPKGQTVSYCQLALAKPSRGDALRQLFYGNSHANPEEMMGFATYYGSRDPKDACNAVNVLDAGGTRADLLCSVWLVGWGPRTIYLASPDGEPISIGGECCLVVADWRYAARIANIDATSPDFDALQWLTRAVYQLPIVGRPSEWLRPTFYMNSDVIARLADVGRAVAMTAGLSAGLTHFRDIPIRQVDELGSDEARIP